MVRTRQAREEEIGRTEVAGAPRGGRGLRDGVKGRASASAAVAIRAARGGDVISGGLCAWLRLSVARSPDSIPAKGTESATRRSVARR